MIYDETQTVFFSWECSKCGHHDHESNEPPIVINGHDYCYKCLNVCECCGNLTSNKKTEDFLYFCSDTCKDIYHEEET
jgi:hypothetical protein